LPELATNLLNELTQNDNPESLVSGNSLEALDETLRCFGFTETSYPSSIRRRLDNEGTKLWNSCLLSVISGHGDKYSVLLCKGIVL
jgi:hypothetical protein